MRIKSALCAIERCFHNLASLSEYWYAYRLVRSYDSSAHIPNIISALRLKGYLPLEINADEFSLNIPLVSSPRVKIHRLERLSSAHILTFSALSLQECLASEALVAWVLTTVGIINRYEDVSKILLIVECATY